MRVVALFLRGVCLLLSWHATGQPAVPLLDQINRSVDERPEVQAARELVNWFTEHRYGVAYFDEIDFRVGGITNDRTEYAFRLRPTNPFYFAAGRNMGKLLEADAHLQLKEAMQAAIVEKMENWLKIRNTVLQYQGVDSAIVWRQKWIDNVQQYIGQEDFDPEEVLDIQLEKLDLEIDKLNLQNELAELLREFFSQQSTDGQGFAEEQAKDIMGAMFPDLSHSRLQAVVESLDQVHSASSLAVEKEQLNVKISEARVQMEKRDWDIGFVQPEWDNSGGDRFGLRVGIGIPIFNTSRVQTQNRQLDVIGDKWTEVKARTAAERKMAGDMQKVRDLIQRLYDLEKMGTQLGFYAEKLGSMGGQDAKKSLLKWLKAKEKLRARMIKDQYLLLTAYLDYLKAKGLLAEPEAVRYLEGIW